jgi:hypothetical protein
MKLESSKQILEKLTYQVVRCRWMSHVTCKNFQSDVTERISLVIQSSHFTHPAVNPALHDGFQCLLFRHTVVRKVHHSNLILVVVNTLCSLNTRTEFKTTMTVGGSETFCLKAKNDNLTRKQPKTCVGRGTEAPKVRQPYWQ